MTEKIKIGDRLLHIPSGRTGIYVEGINIGDGYIVAPDDKGELIADACETFVLIDEEKEPT